MRLFANREILIATHNTGKLNEFAALLAPFGLTCVGAAHFNLPEPAETETTYIGNARIKAQAAAAGTGLPALADDSGIEVDALGGQPGVFTADWAVQPDGSRDFGKAMEKTWGLLQATNAPYPRTARFRATFVLAWPDGREEVFAGRVDGQLVWPRRGGRGHGYDPMFMPDGHHLTFAEMDAAVKNGISHRADAFRKFATWLGAET